MVVHEIRYADDHGRVRLGEFLRLAGLIAAGAADADDLARELALNEMTLLMTAEEITTGPGAQWYQESFDAYRAWMAADEIRNSEDRVNAIESAIADYRALLEDGARWIGEQQAARDVPRFTVPTSRRHLRVVR